MPTRIERALKKRERSREIDFGDGKKFIFGYDPNVSVDEICLVLPIELPGDQSLLDLSQAIKLKDHLVYRLRKVKDK